MDTITIYRDFRRLKLFRADYTCHNAKLTCLKNRQVSFMNGICYQ